MAIAMLQAYREAFRVSAGYVSLTPRGLVVVGVGSFWVVNIKCALWPFLVVKLPLAAFFSCG